MRINKHDTNGTKPLLAVGELGYDNYPSGGDIGRVYVGTGSSNIAQAKKSEVVTVDGKVDTHVARIDNPHAVTKAQVGLGNVDNTSDSAKNVLSATKLTTARTINGTAFDGSANIIVSDSTKLPQSNPSITGSITEQVYNLTGTAINPANGTIQYKTVSANTTFTETLTSGQSVLLRLIRASNYTITFPTIMWVGVVAPTLTANCAIALWKEQSTLYGSFVGTLV